MGNPAAGGALTGRQAHSSKDLPLKGLTLLPDPSLLWDTGLPDALAATPEGTTSANGALHVKRPKTLAGQLDELGVKAADIKAMAISHTHPVRPVGGERSF